MSLWAKQLPKSSRDVARVPSDCLQARMPHMVSELSLLFILIYTFPFVQVCVNEIKQDYANVHVATYTISIRAQAPNFG